MNLYSLAIHHVSSMEYRSPRDCERRVELYADLADESRAEGEAEAADHYLLLAWAAYEGVEQLEEPGGEVCPFPQRDH